MYKPVHIWFSVWTTFRLSFLIYYNDIFRSLSLPKEKPKMKEKLRVSQQNFSLASVQGDIKMFSLISPCERLTSRITMHQIKYQSAAPKTIEFTSNYAYI